MSHGLMSGSYFFSVEDLIQKLVNNIVVAIFTQFQILDNFIFENTAYIIRQ